MTNITVDGIEAKDIKEAKRLIRLSKKREEAKSILRRSANDAAFGNLGRLLYRKGSTALTQREPKLEYDEKEQEWYFLGWNDAGPARFYFGRRQKHIRSYETTSGCLLAFKITDSLNDCHHYFAAGICEEQTERIPLSDQIALELQLDMMHEHPSTDATPTAQVAPLNPQGTNCNPPY